MFDGAKRAVVIRTGALGDVLAVRGAIWNLRRRMPGADIRLIAPGERGRFLVRPGWADSWLDWESADVAWLFSENGAEPPERLGSVFADADAVVAYLGRDDRVLRRLRVLSPKAEARMWPANPPPDWNRSIFSWLAGALDMAGDDGVFPRVAVAGAGLEGREEYAVIHPGSGSAAKNWPPDGFAELGRRLAGGAVPGRPPMRVAIVSGEADGDLGERVADMVPGALRLHSLPLSALAEVLANARLYVGNDSGVSHLSAAVENGMGRCPEKYVVFGPSDERIWAPPGCSVIKAAGGLDRLSAGDVCRIVGGALTIPRPSAL